MEIFRLEICFAILIPWPEKEQNPCSAGNQKSKELQIAWPQGNGFIMSHDGFFISGFPVLDGVSTRVCFSCSLGALTSRARGVDSCDARGKDVHQAAKEDNVGAVRHFLRVDPIAWRGRIYTSATASELKLGATKQIHAFHKLGIFLVKSGLVRRVFH